MPEMLTIKQAVEKLKIAYPATTISATAIRRWQKEQKFHSVTAGRRILISWNSFVAFLNGGEKAKDNICSNL